MIEKPESHIDFFGRLALLGIAVLLILAAAASHLSTFKVLRDIRSESFADNTIELIGLALIAIFLLKSGALTKLAFGSYSAEFGDKNNDLQVRVTNLESSLAALRKGDDPTQPPKSALSFEDKKIETDTDGWLKVPKAEIKPPENDKNKGQFGGMSEREGYKLTASFNFKNRYDKHGQVLLKVEKTEGEVLKGNVQFFLHETFGKNHKARVLARDGTAELNLFIAGGFTVGAWVEGTGVLLELDLALAKDAPEVVRDK